LFFILAKVGWGSEVTSCKYHGWPC